MEETMKRPFGATWMIAAVLAGCLAAAVPASANTKTMSILHIDSRYVDRRTCDFPIRVHEFGPFKIADYYDGDGRLVKEILTAGAGGPFTFTDTANGTTLTMQMQSAPIVTTYNADGTVRTEAINGLEWKFTAPGGGIVLLDTGRLVLDGDGNVIFEVGAHQRQNGDVARFCASFAATS
jgi:hypothetical protein